MNLIPARLHGILDYGVVVLLLLAPSLLFPNSLVGGPVRLCYVLAVAHLIMTLLTDFPLGMVEVVSLGVHGVIELLAALALIVAPWMASFFFAGVQWPFTIFGVLLFVVWLLTDYSGPRAASKTSPPGKRRPSATATPQPGKAPAGEEATSHDRNAQREEAQRKEATHEKAQREHDAQREKNAQRSSDDAQRKETRQSERKT